MTKRKSRMRAVVIGDVMADAYLEASAVGVSDEAPVAVLDWIGATRSPGGMANVAVSLRELGVAVSAVGLLGDDESGRFLDDACKEAGVEGHWVRDQRRETIEKMRVCVGDDYLARLDMEGANELSAEARREVEQLAAKMIPDSDVVVVSDYAKGLIDTGLARVIMETAGAANVPVVVDAKPGHMREFRGAALFTPNWSEAREAARFLGIGSDDDDDDIATIGRKLCKALASPILITCGADGMRLFESEHDETVHTPASASSKTRSRAKSGIVRSTSGAGDVVLAVMAWGIATGLSLCESVRRAGEAAASAVKRPGTCRLVTGDVRS